MKEQYEKEIKEQLEKTIVEELRKLNKSQTIEERLIKFDYLRNVGTILDNYTELEPVINKFLNEKAREQKFKQNETWDSISK